MAPQDPRRERQVFVLERVRERRVPAGDARRWAPRGGGSSAPRDERRRSRRRSRRSAAPRARPPRGRSCSPTPRWCRCRAARACAGRSPRSRRPPAAASLRGLDRPRAHMAPQRQDGDVLALARHLGLAERHRVVALRHLALRRAVDRAWARRTGPDPGRGSPTAAGPWRRTGWTGTTTLSPAMWMKSASGDCEW